MPLTTPMQTSFAGGYISGRNAGRVATDRYSASMSVLQNYIITKGGQLERRPGTEYIATAKDPGYIRLVPFRRGIAQNYILELTDSFMRFYTDGAQILDGTPVQIATPWAGAELADVQYAQDGQYVWFVHPSYTPRRLEWTSDISWTLATPTFTGDYTFGSSDNYPSCISFFSTRLVFANTNTDPRTVWMSEPNTPLSFDESAGDALAYELFTPDMADIQWIYGQSDLLIGLPNNNGILTFGDVAPTASTLPFWRAQTDHGTQKIQPVLASSRVVFIQKGGQRVREMYFQLQKDGYDTPDLLGWADDIIDGTFTDIAVANTPETIIWMLGDGYLIGATYEPSEQVLSWHWHDTGPNDDHFFLSLAVIPGSVSEDEIWFAIYRDGETYVERMMPRDWTTNEVFASQSTNTAHKIFFVDSGVWYGAKTWKTITGISQATTCVVTAANDFVDYDKVWLQDIAGMIELNDKMYTVRNPTGTEFDLYSEGGASPIDSTLLTAYDSAGSARHRLFELTGLDHLGGEDVEISVDGGAHPDGVVAGVSLDGGLQNYGQYTAAVGLGYDSIARTVRLESGGQTGPAQGKKGRVSRCNVRFFRSLGASLGVLVENLSEMIGFRTMADDLGTPPPLLTGDLEGGVEGAFSTDKYLTVAQTKPLPQTVCALMMTMDTNE